MWRVIQGNALDELKKLESESVHCCVTSPPYYFLRDYGLSAIDWPPVEYAPMTGVNPIAVPAWTGCLGNEPTVELYVAHLVLIFREVWRALRKDGTFWLNIGDSFSSGGRGISRHLREKMGRKTAYTQGLGPKKPPKGLKAGELIGVPWRVVFALQADGWYLRIDNAWYKPNALPESVEDRPTKAHEYVFLLAKSGEPQFWTHRDLSGVRTEKPQPDYRWIDHANDDAETDIEPENWRTEEMADGEKRWSRINLWRGHDYFYDAEAVKEPYSRHSKPDEVYVGQAVKDYAAAKAQNPSDTKRRILESMRNGGGRNCRSVWTIPTQPCSFAHFAVMPEVLAERCIKAGTSAVGVCAKCGAPWVRVLEHQRDRDAENVLRLHRRSKMDSSRRDPGFNALSGREWTMLNYIVTVGWRPTCSCGGEPVPAVVLDPFAGAGTTLYVAEKLGRNSIGIELNPSYIEDIIKPRMAEIRYIEHPMFA